MWNEQTLATGVIVIVLVILVIGAAFALAPNINEIVVVTETIR